MKEQSSPLKPSMSNTRRARDEPWRQTPRGSVGTLSPSANPALPTRCSSVVPRPMLPDTLGIVPAQSPPRDGSATTAKAPEPSPPLARGKTGSPGDPLFPPGALEGLGAEDPGILHPLCSQLVGLKQRSAGRGWEKAARANDESWDRTRGILFSCGAAGRQEAPPAAHGTQPPPARGPTGERWAPDRGTARAPLPAPCPGRCQHHSPYSPGETERGLPRAASAMCPEPQLALLRPRCAPAQGRGQPQSHPGQYHGAISQLSCWQGQLLPVLKLHGEPAALSPCWAPEKWPDPPGLRWLPLTPCRGETKQPRQRAEPHPRPGSQR